MIFVELGKIPTIKDFDETLHDQSLLMNIWTQRLFSFYWKKSTIHWFIPQIKCQISFIWIFALDFHCIRNLGRVLISQKSCDDSFFHFICQTAEMGINLTSKVNRKPKCNQSFFTFQKFWKMIPSSYRSFYPW